MAEQLYRAEDLVVIRLTLRGRDGRESLNLNESVTVAQLGLGGAAAEAAIQIDFNADRYADLMRQGAQGNPEATEEALRMLASLNEKSAEFVAAGEAPPAESLAQAVVDWVLETRPQGHKYTTDPQKDGYVISTREINIHGPIRMEGDERIFRVTAVGTWGF